MNHFCFCILPVSRSFVTSRFLSMNSVRITSYNVLSSRLADPSYFNKCIPEFLDSNYRYKKLIEKLDCEISEKSIICLQEVSTPWAGLLHQYFAQRGYYLVTGLYGSKFNGYMGVGMAVPLSEYSIESTDVSRIADNLKLKWPKLSVLQKYINNILVNPFLAVLKFLRLYEPKVNPWDLAVNRYNQAVSMELKHRVTNKSFRVGTYHMPCMFDKRQVMVIHSALVAQYMQQLAQSKPYLLIGDFNLKPGDSEYRLLTEGSLESENPDVPKNMGENDWKINVKPMKSAYKEFNGKEPEFTNYAQNVYQTEPFIGTLDYIFMSEEWKVQNVKPLLQLSECSGPLPLEHEPSDHLLIGATLTLDN